ncbi:type I polyketide synthase [Nostoc sp. FACHB-110]|uniref:type I polyketide synthase n=1 Tax=Nostoc sp. FACHB-110 TaxID=2692834 RepID=UPI0016842C32|nr:type I polyketide synthase [Nostoc sp. FACHB-110]MBD2435877.1 SDR family NAD(P)-dependent oxidoreductase [Nostoc sp. FACHB-110]
MGNIESETAMEGIAIIGMSGRFPGANNIAEFWQNLQAGIESISQLTNEELLSAGINPSCLEDSNYVKASGILENIDLFDAAFFEFNPKEAEITDPQHRLFLECAWSALESAGYDADRCDSRIGVYAGASLNNYLSFDLNSDQVGSAQSYQKLIGNDKDFLATRVSYKLNLTGPSLTVQTACSTSLVAVTLACQSLMNYQCDMALAGGVSIRVPHKTGYLYQPGGTLSPDGRCRAFDAQAQGTTVGNGVGVVLLKRLEDAIADNDHIYAVIKGWAINNDGSMKVGYTAPSVDGQAEAIAEAIMLAGIPPATISYIEAHGTGTTLGDPIEIAALTKVFRTSTDKKNFCAIGSVKTNIGHLDAAAGITGLIKTALALKHQQIPPSLNFERPNPEIDFANSPFYVNTQLTQWKSVLSPRRAGVSSLGMGGTNAHVVLEEAPLQVKSQKSKIKSEYLLLCLSAKTATALEMATQNLANYLQQNQDLNLADVAYTLQVGRKEFNHRRILVCTDIQDAVNALQNRTTQRVYTHHQEPSDRPITFMFPGQGSQYVNMGKELYQTESVFRESVDRCCWILQPLLNLDLRTVIYPSEPETTTAQEQLKQTSFAQPALFVIEYALAQLWMSWSILPSAMIGHSIGEYVAACLAGVMSLEEALTLVAVRSQLMQQLPSGSMLSIPLSEAEVKPLLNENLSLAASNAPFSCVVSGTHAAIDVLSEQLLAKGIECRHLHTSHAFHSQMMTPILQALIAEVKKIRLQPPQIPFISNLTGTWISASEATDVNYWASHLRHTVQFADGISVLLLEPNRILLEVGPGRTLCTFAKQQAGITQQAILSSLRHPQEESADVAFLLNTLGRLWLWGVAINWSSLNNCECRCRLPLPTYPFERQRYWLEPQKPASESVAVNQQQPDVADWFYLPVWQQAITPQTVKSAKQVLIFADTCQVGSQIAKCLIDEGNSVIVVYPGEQFNKLSEQEYSINPSQMDDYDSLIAQLQFCGQIPDAIFHLWSVTPAELTTSGIEYFENCQNLGFYSLLFLAQSFDKYNITQLVDILVVTNDIYDVTGVEKLNPAKATVLGMCKTIPQEYANISCRSLDIVLPAAGTVAEKQLVEQILAEFSAQEFESAIAYRGHHRWVQSYQPLRLNHDQTPKLRTAGVYLITGGLGGIGLEIAEYLAKTFKAKLILISSSTFPSQNEWQQWLINHDAQDKISSKIRKLEELAQLGAEILVLRADVADSEQMQTAITQATACFGQINGVIHAAGIKLFKTVAEISRSECEEQLKANGYGLYILAELVQEIELDFCILISSLSSILGALGMAAYPAAHHFTDAFVYQHNQTNSTPWISVNWDNWLTSQLAPELAAKPEISTQLFMNNHQGIEVFKRVLSLNKVNQIVVSTTNLAARIAQWVKPSVNIQPHDLTLHARPSLQNNYVAPRNEIEQTIAHIWQEILGIEQVGIEDNFLELGGDSLLSIQITARANKAGLRFTNQHLFEYPTIAQLAEIASRTQTVLSEQGLVTGELPLTPIQHWFFEQNLVDAHHWNQTVVLEVQQSFNPRFLQQAVQNLLIQHDALRLRFQTTAASWQQINASSDEVVPFEEIDLSELSLQQQEPEFTALISEIQASLNLTSGPIVRVVFFNLGSHQPSRILLAIHHLAIDVGSWRILLADLETAYQQLSQGKLIKLPAKTTSFKQWALRLTQYAESIELQREQVYWLAAERDWVSPLPVDYPDGANTVASAETISVTLSVEATQALQEEIAATYRVQTDDLLLAALAQAFRQWTGTSAFLVDLEGNGRDVIFDDVDLSRTVGWFTNIAPMLLEIGEVEETTAILKQVKEQIRSFPNQGLGYGVLRYLSSDEIITEKLRSLQPAEVLFLYLGNYEQTVPESALFKLSPKFAGLSRSSRAQRSHLLEINALIVQNQLKVELIYSHNVYRRQTINKLAQDFQAALQALISDSQSSSAKNFTPSDFAEFKLSQWNQDDIDHILAAINQAIASQVN